MTKEELPENHRFLKWVVIILGVLIVICVAIIVITLMARMAGGAKKNNDNVGSTVIMPQDKGVVGQGTAVSVVQAPSGKMAQLYLQPGERVGAAQLQEGLILLPVLEGDRVKRLMILKARTAAVISEVVIKTDTKGSMHNQSVDGVIP